MDLKGATVRYFKTIDAESEKKETNDLTTPDDEPSTNSQQNSTPTTPDTNANEAHANPLASSDDATSAKIKKKDGIRDFWEQAKENITKTTENINKSLNAHHQYTAKIDPNAPRGSIDLIKENASVAALSGADSMSASNYAYMGGGSSASPTPFGICILVKNESKWKICFDTQKEQMKWLSALTQVVIQNNVDFYNEELTKSRRGVSSSSIELQEVGATCDGIGAVERVTSFAMSEDTFRSPPGGQDNELWKTDTGYSIDNMVNGVGSDSGQEQENKDDNSVTGTDADGIKATSSARGIDIRTVEMAPESPISFLFDLINQGATTGPAFSLTGNNLCLASFVYNVTMYVVYAVESKWVFRFLMIFSNFFFWLLVSDSSADSKVESKQLKSMLLNSIEKYFFGNNVQKKASLPKGGIEKDSEKKERSIDLPKIINDGVKPYAGSTTVCSENVPDDGMVNGNRFISWDVLSPDHVQVRSHGYLKSKKKIPSPPSLYEVIGCDLLRSDMRPAEIAAKVELPKMDLTDGAERTWKSPDVFVVSLAVPTEEPSFSRPENDGVGISLIVYYKMKEETREILRNITAPEYDGGLNNEINDTDIQRSTVNAVKLWEKWCIESPTDEKMQARFKFIPNVHNTKDLGLPSYISKYCGKPVLIKRANVTGFLSSHPEVNAMEFGISLHPFPYLAKKAMAYLKTSILPHALVSLSYVIEGRSDDELPEVLIGDAMKINYPDPDNAVESVDFFAGTAKSSVLSNVPSGTIDEDPIEETTADGSNDE